ncbi:LysR family transcriptional regulator [Pseudogracilibacillus auburnensis]|uniref:LysR family transcriptional regulator n=1 Tax=Pseudogracilibacillus auburnensis TaxID=1494959 RepID=UPI001A971BCE|nr:LysR family transcriptional regulator [Pseudogracilibacillus auburnensis]MBO1003197.1 LysR family transcriptional regulator [Pseudogracilibacillus auburnensis]
MDIRLLIYFKTIVKHRQFTRAAEELHISQPSLSNAIKGLEQELGCKLFERSTKKLILTEPGQILYRHACKVLVHFENIHKEMSDAKNVGAGNISIGMIESYRYFIAPIINRFKKAYPNIHIKIREMGPKEIERSLKNYDIHIGITSKKNDEEEYDYKPIFQERYVLITPINHSFEPLSNIDITDLKNEMFIHSLEGFEVRNAINKTCQEAGFTPNFEYEAESLETARSLVEAGLGLSIVPESFMEHYPIKKVKLVYLNNHLPKRTVYFVYQSQRYLLPAIKDFMKIAADYSPLKRI